LVVGPFVRRENPRKEVVAVAVTVTVKGAGAGAGAGTGGEN